MSRRQQFPWITLVACALLLWEFQALAWAATASRSPYAWGAASNRLPIDVHDFMTKAQRADAASSAPFLDQLGAINAALAAAPPYGKVVFNGGRYLISGPNGIVVSKPVTLEFKNGASLIFDDNDAQYIQISSSDVTLLAPRIDGGSDVWTRTDAPAINVASDVLAAYTGIKIMDAIIENVAGPGIMIGSTITAVQGFEIQSAVVRNSGADGISVIGPAADGKITSPRVYNSGDDGVSIVGYSKAAAAPKNIKIVDALSDGSLTRGLTVVGGQSIELSGRAVGSRLQGVLIIQDIDDHATYRPEQVAIDVTVENSGGTGVEIGRNAKKVSGSATVVGAHGDRGILIGSGPGEHPSQISMSKLTATRCSGVGIEIGNATDVIIKLLKTFFNGQAGLIVGTGATDIVIDDVTSYNNNQLVAEGADNILVDGALRFEFGRVTSIDDNMPAKVERIFDCANSAEGVIRDFTGSRNRRASFPNIQHSCRNIRLHK